MSKRLTWMCVWAVMFALCGCSDEGNKERDSEKTCDPACADGFECRNGACVEKDDKTEPGTGPKTVLPRALFQLDGSHCTFFRAAS